MKRKRRDPQPPPAPHSDLAQTNPPAPRRPAGRGPLAIVFAVLALLLLLAASSNVSQLNTDAIAYLRIAEYYAHGESKLMVSGYWGPLLSWLIAIPMKLGVGPLMAARAVMAASALVFTLGACALFGRVKFASHLRVVATGIVGLVSISWSVEVISPDLLLAGLFLLAISEQFADEWLGDRKTQLRAGLWWVLAYLAKPVAFPLAFALTLAIAGLHWIGCTGGLRRVLCAAGVSLGVFTVLSAPWVTILSVKYGGFTFSTSGRINHAIVGPGNADNIGRYHPVVREFHTPDVGRVTMWEDPSRMKYPYWSPFASAGNLQHQIGLIQRNALVVTGVMANLDWFSLGLLSLLGCCFLRPPWRESLARERWCWVLMPLLLLGGIYLPVYVQPSDERYFYAAMPLTFVSALSVALALTGRAVKQTSWPRWIALFVVCASFSLYPLFRAAFAITGMENVATHTAQVLAAKIQAAGIKGSIAGSGMVKIGFPQRAGLYTAYFLGVPWHGDEENATPERFLQSGAHLAIVPRGTGDKPEPLAPALAANPAFRDLDAVLFKSTDEAAQFPVKVFEITQK